MESTSKISEAAIEANIEYFRALRDKIALQAIKAHQEEMKWVTIRKMNRNPHGAMTDLMSPSYD
jgi:uncharacterized protein YaaN involved in tellurite resistance